MPGVPLHVPLPSLLLYTDKSLSGWGTHILDLTASGVWSEEKSQEHINVQEMRAVELALASFLPQLAGQSVVLISDNASVIAYLRHQGSTVSSRLRLMASAITLWTEQHSVRLEAHYIPGKKNILADQLSWPDQVLPMEWSMLPHVFDGICRVFGCPQLDLFATWANAKLPLYVSPVPDPLAWKKRHPSPSMESSRGVCPSPVRFAPSSHLAGHGVGGSKVTSRGSSLATERMVHGSSGPSRSRTS